MGPIPFEMPLAADEIARKRAVILSELWAMDEGFCSIPVRSIRQETLRFMLTRYDGLFFQGYITKKFPEISVTLSSRLTSAAGKFVYQRGAFGRIRYAEIRMSSDFLLRLDQGPFMLNGLLAATPQEAFLFVFEHELCHAAEIAFFGQTSHSQRFLLLANGLFGHTATRHSLPTRKQEAAKQGLCVGAKASFAYNGNELTGIIAYIGKTATVMVPSPLGEYRDKAGRKYCKYRVAIEKLKK